MFVADIDSIYKRMCNYSKFYCDEILPVFFREYIFQNNYVLYILKMLRKIGLVKLKELKQKISDTVYRRTLISAYLN